MFLNNGWLTVTIYDIGLLVMANSEEWLIHTNKELKVDGYWYDCR